MSTTPTFSNYLDLVKHFEVFNSEPKEGTIGFGHKGKDVTEGKKITEAEATELLNKDMMNAIDQVRYTFVNKPLNDNQLGALYSFCYNEGIQRFINSDLVKRILAGFDPNTVAREELPKFVHRGGKVDPELVQRRHAEIALFTKGAQELLPVPKNE